MHLQGQYAQRQFIRGPVPQYHSAALPPNAITQQALAAAAAGHGLNMFLPGAYPNNQNSTLSAAQAQYFGFPRNFMTPNMAMQQRPQRWAPPGAPGGPQGNGMMRPMGGVPGLPPNMMRPGNAQSAVPNQQPRFPPNPSMGPHPVNVSMAPGTQIRQPVGQQQRVIGGNMAGAISAPSAGSNVRPAQVQFSMAARNIQPSMNAGQVRPVAEGNPSANGAQPNSGDYANAMSTMPIEEFMQFVQSKSGPDQKQLLGEKLYSILKDWHPQAAGKLTGMLLEIDNRELMSIILEHHKTGAQDGVSTLRSKFDSALQALNSAQPGQEGAKKDTESKPSE